jgi:hypothetical protein
MFLIGVAFGFFGAAVELLSAIGLISHVPSLGSILGLPQNFLSIGGVVVGSLLSIAGVVLMGGAYGDLKVHCNIRANAAYLEGLAAGYGGALRVNRRHLEPRFS